MATTGTAAFFLSEKLSTFDFVGMSFVLFSLFIGTLKKNRLPNSDPSNPEDVIFEKGEHQH